MHGAHSMRQIEHPGGHDGFWIEYLKKKECYPQLLEEHQTIIDSIESRDKGRATQITGQHIKNQAEAVVDTIREKEESI